MAFMTGELAEVLAEAVRAVSEAADASNADMAALIASAGLPGEGISGDLATQRDELAALKQRLSSDHLPRLEAGRPMDLSDRRVLLRDLRAVLDAVRVAVYDLVRNGEAGGLVGTEVRAALGRLLTLDARLRERVIPQLRRELDEL